MQRIKFTSKSSEAIFSFIVAETLGISRVQINIATKDIDSSTWTAVADYFPPLGVGSHLLYLRNLREEVAIDVAVPAGGWARMRALPPVWINVPPKSQ